MCGQHSWVIAQRGWHWIVRDPTLTQTKHRRDYVDSSPCLACISITVTPHHKLTSNPPSQPITKYQSPLPPARTVWVHPAGMNCIIDHLLYIHTGIIMFTITLPGLWTLRWWQIGYHNSQESKWWSIISWWWQNITIIHTLLSFYHQPYPFIIMEKCQIAKIEA